MAALAFESSRLGVFNFYCQRNSESTSQWLRSKPVSFPVRFQRYAFLKIHAPKMSERNEEFILDDGSVLGTAALTVEHNPSSLGQLGAVSALPLTNPSHT